MKSMEQVSSSVSYDNSFMLLLRMSNYDSFMGMNKMRLLLNNNSIVLLSEYSMMLVFNNNCIMLLSKNAMLLFNNYSVMMRLFNNHSVMMRLFNNHSVMVRLFNNHSVVIRLLLLNNNFWLNDWLEHLLLLINRLLFNKNILLASYDDIFMNLNIKNVSSFKEDLAF